MPLHDKVLPDETSSIKECFKSQEEEIGKTSTPHLEVLVLNFT